MAEQAPSLTRHDLETKIIKHCWEDEAFRKEFTADPAAAFAKYLEVPAANLPKISVYQEEPGSWHIILPAKPVNAKELSNEDLEKVAGGATPTISLIVSAETISLIVSATKSVSENEGGW
jgi:hypothetical protein